MYGISQTGKLFTLNKYLTLKHNIITLLSVVLGLLKKKLINAVVRIYYLKSILT